MPKADAKKFVLIAIVVVVALYLLIQFIGSPSAKKQPNVTQTGEFPQSKSNEDISAAELERVVTTAPSFKKLGPGTRILLKFYDGNGRELGQPRFLVGEGGTVTEVNGFVDFDVALITGDYYINEIKSTNDICGLLRRIKSNKDFNVELNIDPITGASRYGVLNDCVPLS